MLDRIIGAVELFYIAYFTLLNATYLFFAVIALFDLTRYRRRVWSTDLRVLRSGTGYLPISILVPAFNERETIVTNVRSLLTIDYPEYEVVVINDGSTDDTLERLVEAYALTVVPVATREVIPTRPVVAVYRSLDLPNLVVLDKARGGKSDALNAGINLSQYPLFCSIDADCLLQSDALLRIARALAEDDRIVAAGGIIRVLNGAVVRDGQVVEARAPRPLLLLVQSQDYVRGFLTGRTALAKLNSLLILSGAFALFRKDAVVRAGGYSADTVTEDLEIIVRLRQQAVDRKERTRIIFVPDPVCWTQIPSDLGSLRRQRDRWQRGLIETLWKYRRMFGNPRYGVLGMFAMPYHLLFEALGPVIEFCGYVFVVLLFLLGQLDVPFALLFFALAVGTGIALSLFALLLEDMLFPRYESTDDLVRMAAGAVLEYVGFRQLLSLQRTVAFFGVIGRNRSWGRIRRVAIPQTTARRRRA